MQAGMSPASQSHASLCPGCITAFRASWKKALAHSGNECNTSSNRFESIECHCLLRVQCWESLSKAGPQHPYIDHIAHIREQVAACKITPRAWCVVCASAKHTVSHPLGCLCWRVETLLTCLSKSRCDLHHRVVFAEQTLSWPLC